MEPYSQTPIHLTAEQETYWYFGGLRIIQALENQIGISTKIFEYKEPVGTYTSSYAPYAEDTAFYIVAGEARFSNGEMTVHATAGTFLFLPRNRSFHYQVTGSTSATILTWTTPMGFTHQLLHTGKPGQVLVLPPPHIFEQDKIQRLTMLLRNTTHVGG